MNLLSIIITELLNLGECIMEKSIFKTKLWKFKLMVSAAVSLIEDTMIDGVIIAKVCVIVTVKRRGKKQVYIPHKS